MNRQRNSNRLNEQNIEDILALTPMQEGILFHYLRDPRSDRYFEQLILQISGEINIRHFKKAWNFVIETNEMLRTLFRWEKVDQPVQIMLFLFSTDLFKRSTIEKMANHFIEILQQVLENQHIKLKDIKIATALKAAQSKIHQVETGFEF